MENLDAISDASAELTVERSGVVKDQHINTKNNIPNTTFDSDDISVSPPARELKVLILDVGGRIFKTSRITLLESGLFCHQLSSAYTWEPEANGSFFLDADPDLFEHLLRFMRRPNIFPLFYTTANGFDYDLYNRLENEAEYFQIDALYTWINLKKYLRAVVRRTYQPQTRNLDELVPEVCPVNEAEEKHMIPRIKKVYICPRGIIVHRGNPDKCGQACRKAQGDDDDEFEDVPYTEVVTVRKEVEFVDAVCRLE